MFAVGRSLQGTARKIPKYTAVKVTWLDPTAESDWHKPEEQYAPAVMQSLGFVAACDEISLTIFPTVADAHDDHAKVADGTVIPWGCVQKVEILKAKLDR